MTYQYKPGDVELGDYVQDPDDNSLHRVVMIENGGESLYFENGGVISVYDITDLLLPSEVPPEYFTG